MAMISDANKNIPKEIAEDITRLQTLQNALGHIEDKLTDVLAATSGGRMERIDKAKLDACLAYALSSLTYALLKTKGIQTENHDIMGQLKNVGSVFKRVKAAAASESQVEGDQRSTRVDVAAGKRIINHTLATNASMESQPAPFGGKKKANSSGESSSSEVKRRKK